MRGVARAVVHCTLLMAALSVRPGVGAQSRSDDPVPAEPRLTLPSEFAGVWDYNAAESINVVTGRPEQSPRSATTQRGTAGGGAPVSRGGGGDGGTGFGGGGRRGGGGPLVGATPEMMRETRDMSRDLLEVPEALTIALDGAAVSFTDDIERERTYPVDGTKQKYRLGASEFTARVQWTGTQLRKDIEGSFGFRMSEVYFLSPDARRLFVIIRLGNGRRTQGPVGFNRVYDRVDPASAERASVE